MTDASVLAVGSACLLQLDMYTLKIAIQHKTITFFMI